MSHRTLVLSLATLAACTGSAPADGPLAAIHSSAEEVSDAPLDTARAVAATFVAARAPEVGWLGARVGEAWLVRHVDGRPAFAEMEVIDDQGVRGFVDVALSRDETPVLGFSGEGAAPVADLLRGVPQEGVVELVTGAGGDLGAVLEVGGELLHVSDLAGDLSEAHYAERFAAGAPRAPVAQLPGDPGELEGLWAAYDRGVEAVSLRFDGQVGSVADASDPLDRGSRAVGRGAVEFPTWSQPPKSKWPWACAIGCTPLAAATLLAHHDAKAGYGNVMPGDALHLAADSKEVMAVLGHLRNAMGTYCSWFQGITPHGNNIKDAIFTYLAGRGYRWGAAQHYPGEGGKSLWDRLRNQINANRPVLLHWEGDDSSVGHSVVVYEYEENAGNQNDWVCMKYGDGRFYRCENRKRRSWIGLTRVVPN